MYFKDMHTDDEGRLIRDIYGQDCKNFSFDYNYRMFTFERQFDTCDGEDYVIKVSTFGSKLTTK